MLPLALDDDQHPPAGVTLDGRENVLCQSGATLLVSFSRSSLPGHFFQRTDRVAKDFKRHSMQRLRGIGFALAPSKETVKPVGEPGAHPRRRVEV